MTDIVIQGIYGRMGHALIEKIAARQDCRVVAGVDREAGKVGDIPVYAGFEGLPKVDAIIDFSSPAGAVAAVQYGAVHGVPCVICSTGLSAEDETVLEDASAKTPIFRSANMSLGVNVLIELARQATRVLSGEFDIEIVEKHHHNKLIQIHRLRGIFILNNDFPALYYAFRHILLNSACHGGCYGIRHKQVYENHCCQYGGFIS